MSIPRQPGRPSPDDFIHAAARFDANGYSDEVRIVATPYCYYSVALSAHEQRLADRRVIEQEYLAYGLAPELSLAQFATEQLARYQKNTYPQ